MTLKVRRGISSAQYVGKLNGNMTIAKSLVAPERGHPHRVHRKKRKKYGTKIVREKRIERDRKLAKIRKRDIDI